jgi:carboxypeptidase C (cathepsin A)
MRNFKYLFPIMLLYILIVPFNKDYGKSGKQIPEIKDSLKMTEPTEVITEGSVSVNSKEIKYKAVAGTLILKNNNDEKTASIFYVAYFNDAANDKSKQPVTFLFNGGPGSSTIWLHMGAFGPKRVEIPASNSLPSPPFKLLNNEYSLLDVSDLVFIDAPGTGFSRITGKGRDEDFYGVDNDANAFAQFVGQFLSKYGRWNSPKYLFGESYGTTRAAVLSNILEMREDIKLNGVMLLSVILNFDTFADYPQYNPGVDLPYILSLPTAAATAWYHNKLPGQKPDFESFINNVKEFAMNDYASALLKGSLLDPEQKHIVTEKFHDYTGLPVSYIEKSNLRINNGQFEKELQSDSGLTTGRLDTRYSGYSMDPLSKEAEYDPVMSAISSAYVSLFNGYVRKDLKYGEGLTYRPMIGLWRNWNFLHRPPEAEMPLPISANVLPDIAAAMKYNPDLKIMVNSGYFDMATPFFAAEYSMHHLQIPKDLQKNIEYHYYKSGHMVYVDPVSLKKLHDNVVKFIRETDNLK